MYLRKKSPQYYAIVRIPIVLIILTAFILSGWAIFENVRFVKATAQIYWFVGKLRNLAAEQKNRKFVPGEDLWDDLVQVGQISSLDPRKNPWGSGFRSVAMTAAYMRVELDLPSQDCRRISLYYLGQNMSDMGLTSIAAKADQDDKWYLIYPLAAGSPAGGAATAAEKACGDSRSSSLAMIFKIR